MMMTLELGPGFRDAAAMPGRLGAHVRAAASAGLAEGVDETGDHIAEHYLSGQYLNVRTGILRKEVHGWMATETEGVIGIPDTSPAKKYKWLLGDDPANQPKTIRPKNAKYLTIPIGEALTASGVVKGKYREGPRSVKDGFFIQSKGQLLFGYKNGKRGKFRPLFVLKKEVQVYDTGALVDGVNDKLDDITDKITTKIQEKAQ